MRWLVPVAVLLAIAAGCIPSTRPASCDASAATFELTLTATSLAPDDPAVCRGQEVTLEVDSSVTGVLHIHGYDDAVPATEVRTGEVTTVTFTANRSGQFPIELHPGDDPTGVGIGVFTVHEP